MFYVYILICSDNRSYVGSTNNLNDRLRRHQAGYVTATKHRLPIKLFCYFAFSSEHQAFSFEQYLKTGNGRAFLSKHIFSPEI